MDDDYLKFDRELLYMWMKHAKVKQKDFAAELGIKPQTLHTYTNAARWKSEPKLDVVAKMAKNLPWGQRRRVWGLRDEDYRLLVLLRGTAPNKMIHEVLERGML